jgi:anti-anti-sigma regulatory factor
MEALRRRRVADYGEREERMNEHGKDTGIENQVESLHVVEAKGSRTNPRAKDLVLDLSGARDLNVANLSLLLTAQQQAQEEDRAVWLAGVPFEVWRSLHIMGLGSFFKPFPTSGKVDM